MACFDAVQSRRLRMPLAAVECLNLIGDGATAAELRSRKPELGSLRSIERLLSRMTRLGLLRDTDEQWPWASWSPEASFFHFGTRGGSYPDDARDYDLQLRRKARHDPPPPPTKSIDGPRIVLAKPRNLGPWSQALRERRTWRHFGTQPVALDDLSALLYLTWGVQHWADVKGQGRVALKTSPSGGARHSVEAYLLARHVRGLKAGLYHYDAATHDLVDLRRSVTRSRVVSLLAKQSYYGEAAAVVVMSAVFARAMWRYPYSKSFRSVLAETGHLAQTFCVSAAALGLAPFCTMAFHEQQMDRFIRVDGTHEAALYVVGVGSRSAAHERQPGRLTTGEKP